MRKGQAAMEFLMTYGWAILVVLAAISALAYFGVLSPGKFLPSSCLLESGISCDHKIEPSQATLVLRNGIGKDITVTSLNVSGCIGSAINQDIASGDQKSITITGCSNGNQGDRFKGKVTLKYTEKETSLNKTMEGSIAAKIE